MAPPPLSKPPKSTLRPAIIVFGTDEGSRAECERVAIRRGLAYVEVRNLHAACTALVRYPASLVIVCSPIKAWDHEVLVDRAAISQANVRVAAPNDDIEAICDDVGITARMPTPSGGPISGSRPFSGR